MTLETTSWGGEDEETLLKYLRRRVLQLFQNNKQ